MEQDRGEGASELRFDRVEHDRGAAAGVSCAGCGQAIPEAYYEVNGNVICTTCHTRLGAGREAGGSGGRFGKAVVLGSLAGVLGAGIYYAIAALTGYEFGLVAIVVGFLVGGAVRMGSGRRGGRPYQLLAAGLTYCAIVATYAPAVFEGLRQATAEGAPSEGAEAAPDAGAASLPTAGEPRAEEAGALEWVFAVALLAAIILAAPFLAGFQNVLGWVIIGIGLFEAWKMNRAVPFESSGPHWIGGGAT